MAIEKYKGGWRVNVHTGKSADNLPAPFTHKRRLTRVVKTSFADAKKLEREWQDLVAEVKEQGSATASDFAQEFLDLCKTGTTRQTYDFALRAFLREYGDKPLAAWSEREARRIAATLPKGNVVVVKTMFAKAVERGLLDASPFRDVAPSTGRQLHTKEDFHKLWPTDAAEQRKVFSKIIEVAGEFGTDAAALVAWQGWTGTRPGEAFVLHRANLNLAADLATINSNYDRSTGEESHGTKNHLTREIVVPPIPELREALAKATANLHSPYVFTNKGKPWSPATWHDRWKQIRRISGNPNMRFYDLRHFCATQLLEAGVTAEDVAVQLGHTDGGELVRTVYGHPSEDAARDRIRYALANLDAPIGHIERHTFRAESA